MGDTGIPGNATDFLQRGEEAEICSAMSCWFGVQRAWSGSSGVGSSSGPSVCQKWNQKMTIIFFWIGKVKTKYLY